MRGRCNGGGGRQEASGGKGAGGSRERTRSERSKGLSGEQVRR